MLPARPGDEDGAPEVTLSGWTRGILAVIVAVPILFNAVSLLPEAREAVPSSNDDAVHYLFIQRASEALDRGESPVDHWLADIELGFPVFSYYQHLPHLTVALLYRLLPKSVSLLTLFNLVRYLLLVGFPLTVFWSLRRMGFSAVAASAAAAASTLIHSPGYGIEFNSYLFRGLGMYTQLWAIHLALAAIACLHTVLYRGRGYVVAILACSALGLSHLIYSYFVAVAAVVMFVAGLKAGNLRARIGRLAAVGGLAGAIGSYLVVPLLLAKPFASTSVYLESWKPNSFGAKVILGRLVNGEMLDAQRVPVLTVLLALGVVAAVTAKKGPARLVLGIFTTMLLLSFGRVTWGRIVDLLPMGGELHFSRFIGATQLLALPLVGLGAEWLWRLGTGRSERWRAAVFGLGAAAVLVVPLIQLRTFYEGNAQWLRRTREAIAADADARAILAALKMLPPGRTYAGLRANWGNAPSMRFGDVSFADLLAFHRIESVAPPYQSFSLTADLIWHFDDTNPAHYDLFDVRYVVAPAGQAVARFLKPVKVTARYTLHEAATGGYGAFVSLSRAVRVRQQENLFFLNRDWLVGLQPGGGRFVQEEYPASSDDSSGLHKEGCPAGTIRENRVGPESFDLSGECSQASTMLLKTTFHPNWRVTIDGAPVKTFMISPGFIGFPWPAGAHRVLAEYRSTRMKSVLLVLGAAALVATVGLRRRFTRFEEWLGRLETLPRSASTGSRPVIDWPALPSGEDVVWDGKAFRTHAGSTRVLSCSADLTGWDDELTDLHEIEAGLGTHPVDRASRRNAIEMLRAMYVRTDGAVLEVGCSSGFLLQDLIRAYPDAEVVGADTTRASLERVGATLPSVPLLQMDLLSCPLPGGQFDAVVALNVLEHIEDDSRALSQIARLLKPGGVFVVEVPQGPALFDSYDALLRHVRRYSRAELLAKIRDAGLNVERVTSLGFVPYPPFYAVKKISRFRYGVRGERSTDHESNVRAQIRSTSRNVLLDAAFAVETRIRPLGRFLPGIRCAAAARKPIS